VVILTEPYGQTSNQFFQHIHLDSFCRDHGICFYNDFLSVYYNDYPNLKLENSKNLYKYLLKSFFKFKLSGYSFDEEKDNESYKSKILNSRILYCRGWSFRSPETLAKYRSYYLKIFNPNIDKASLERLWLSKSNVDEKIIAVHIRRGDYKTFMNGAYFYANSVYSEKMLQLASLFNYNCKFIIFSNDDELSITNLKVPLEMSLSKNSTVVDHYLMSKCDYIIGPPSSFTMWASFIGEVPYFHIHGEEENLTLERFIVCNG
jgi:hypothetical protein